MKGTSVKELIKENFFQILSLIVVIFNLWLANTLAPISANLSLVEQRVSALERLNPISQSQYLEVCERLNRIESKLDNFILKDR